MRLSPRSIAVAALLLLPPLTGALAQPARGPPPATDWSLSVGAAGLLTPAFQGSRDYAFSVVPDVRLRYRERLFASVPEGLGFNVVTRSPRENGWKLGPLVKYRFGRDEDGRGPFTVAGGSRALRGLGDVGGAAELGGFVDYRLGAAQARVELRHGLGGHEGLVADLQLDYIASVGPLRLSVGPRLTLASAGYLGAYFGVGSSQAARSGLPEYRPGGGLVSYGLGGRAILPLVGGLSATLFAGYERLGGPAAGSPLVRLRGSPDQAVVGLGLGWRFDLGAPGT